MSNEFQYMTTEVPPEEPAKEQLPPDFHALLDEKIDTQRSGIIQSEVLCELDTTYGGLIGRALLAGVSVQAIKDIRANVGDVERLLTRAIDSMERYCQKVRVYSQGVNYHLDGRTAATRRDFIDYVRGPNRKPGRGQRYKARALVRNNFDDQNDFEKFMARTNERARSIVKKGSAKPQQRQVNRDLVVAQENMTAPTGAPDRKKGTRWSPGTSSLRSSLYSRMTDTQLKKLRSDYVVGQRGIIDELDVDRLSRSILDIRPFPGLAEPQTGESSDVLVIRPDNTIAVGNRKVRLLGQRLLLFNVLLLLKGQIVTVPDLQRTGLPAEYISESMFHLRKRFESDDNSKPVFEKGSVLRNKGYCLNGQLSIMDTRPPSKHVRGIFSSLQVQSDESVTTVSLNKAH